MVYISIQYTVDLKLCIVAMRNCKPVNQMLRFYTKESSTAHRLLLPFVSHWLLQSEVQFISPTSLSILRATCHIITIHISVPTSEWQIHFVFEIDDESDLSLNSHSQFYFYHKMFLSPLGAQFIFKWASWIYFTRNETLL